MQVSVARSLRTRHESHLSAFVEHHARHPDFTQQVQGRQSAKAIFRKPDESFQPMTHARQAQHATFVSDAKLKLQMACLHRDSDAETVNGQNPRLGYLRGG